MTIDSSLYSGHAHVPTLVAAARRCIEQTEQLLQKTAKE